MIIEVLVKDEAGNRVDKAVIDIDKKVWPIWREYEIKESEIIVGKLIKGKLYDDGWNVETVDGYCKLDVPEGEYRLRAAKYLWLNEDGKRNWTAFQEWKGTKLEFTIYTWWVSVYVSVKDDLGNPVKNAYIDIDYHDGWRWNDFDADHEFTEVDIFRGSLTTAGYKGDKYNVVTDEEGKAGFFIWKRGYKYKDGDDLPNRYRFRVGKEGYLNKDWNEDWTEFQDTEVKLRDRVKKFTFTLYPLYITVECKVRDQCAPYVPGARIDVDVNYKWDPRWYEYDKFKPEDVIVGEIDRSELYDDTINIKVDNSGYCKFLLPRRVNDSVVEYYGLRAAQKDYKNERREWDWTDRKEFEHPPSRISQEFELTKPCNWSEPCTWNDCTVKIPIWVYIVGGVVIFGGIALGTYMVLTRYLQEEK